MNVTRETLTTGAKRAADRAEKALGKETARQLVEAADETLIKLGHDAERRQRRRAVKRAVKKVAKAAAVVGASAAAVLVARNALSKHK